MSTLTLNQRMADTRNKSSGFDYLRLILSFAVILWHSYVLSHGRETAHLLPAIFVIPARSILICFFALSGFLVAGSLYRCRTLFSFLGLRVIRIVPALAVEVLISAFLLGAIVTTLPLSEYFSSSEFRSYALNILGDIHYTLPGVFDSNPFPRIVNGQLWTIPWEFKCYLALALLSLVGAVRRPSIFLVALVGLQIILGVRGVMAPADMRDFAPGEALVMAFLYGVGAYVFRERIPYSKHLLTFAVISATLLLAWGKGNYFAALPLTYVTVYCGLLNPTKGAFIKSGDYSYGLYLYGFPVQQVIAGLGVEYQFWHINFLIASCVGLAIAYISWNYIELPCSKLRNRLLSMEEIYTKWRERLARVVFK